jgi:esterase
VKWPAPAAGGVGTSGVSGTQTVVLKGDPTKPGMYTLLLRVGPNTKIDAHAHPDDRVATVVSGTWYFGYGKEFNDAALKRLPAGSFYTEPPNTNHFAMTRDEGVVIQITGNGPSGTTYVDPAKDPARRGAAVQPADRFMLVNGLRLHFLDWGGNGPPLILIHGLDRHAHTFDHIAPHYASRYHVIAVDMRGHGDSTWDPEAQYFVADYVRDLEGLVRALGLRNIIVWGNSTGGRVAQVFAGLHPELVTHMISEDVGPERPRQIADSYGRRVSDEQTGWASEAELAAQLRKSNPGMPEANIATYIRYGTKTASDGRIVWKRDPKVANGFVVTDLWPSVSRITAPALYIIGGRSSLVPAETQERLKQTLPRVRIDTIAGVGHYPSDERPAEVLALVDAFLR